MQLPVDEPRLSDERPRVGVIGYGLAGEVFHAQLVNTCADLSLAGVLTRDPRRASSAQSRYPGVSIASDLDELLALDLDLVVVASPNAVHADHARAALEAGCAVVVDKPLALTAAKANELVVYAHSANRLLSVFQNRRRDSDQLTLTRLLAEGAIGTVFRHESRFERWRPELDPSKWRESLPAADGGGQLLDLGSHLIDQSIQLFGPVERVYAEVSARRGGADDAVFVALTHTSGTASHLSMGAVFGSPGPRRRVLGEAGAFVIEQLDRQEDQLRSGVTPADADFGVESPDSWGRLHLGTTHTPVPSARGDWGWFYPAMAAAMRGEAPVPVDPADAVSVLSIIEAARESARTATTVGM